MKLKFALLTGTVVSALALGGMVQAQPYNGAMNGRMQNGMPYAGQNGMQSMMQNEGSGSGNGEQGLTPRDVRQFMHNAQHTLSQAIESGNMQQLRQWTRTSIANDAVFSGNRSTQAHGITKSISAMTFSKQDLMRLESLGSGGAPGMLSMIRNYNVSINVLNMRPVGEGAALVRVRISQSRTLGGSNQESRSSGAPGQDWQSQAGGNGLNGAFASGNDGGSSGSGQGASGDETVGQGGGGQGSGDNYAQQQSWSGNGPGGAQLRTDATCDYLLERNPNSGQVQIAMGICSGKTQTPF